MTEAWRDLQPGDTVKVVLPLTKVEADVLGRTGQLVRFSVPHGYAVVRELHGSAIWHLHPEALERVT